MDNMQEVVDWVDEYLERTPLRLRLYERQKEALHSILNEFSLRRHVRGILQLPTGAGKTICVAALALALYQLGILCEKSILLYLTPRIILKGQVEDKFEDIFSKILDRNRLRFFRIEKPEERIIERLKFFLGVWGENENRVLVLIITPKALHELFRELESHGRTVAQLDNIGKIKFLVMDEVHRVYFGPNISDSISELLDNVSRNSPSIILGTSATPIREAIEAIGPILYSLSSIQAMREGILTGKLKIYSTTTQIKLKEAIYKDEWSVAVIERAEKYSEEILERLREELSTLYPGLQDPLTKRIPKTLVIAANTTEADEIASNLRRKLEKVRGKRGANKLVRIAHYKINEAVKEIERFRKQDEGILVTVNMADIGFDDENLEVLVIGRPVRTPIGYVQIRGRVLRRPRKTEDNLKASRYAVIIDLTGAAKKFEKKEVIEEVELGRIEAEDVNRLEEDLRGGGRVDKVHGDVEISKDYMIIEVPEEESLQRHEIQPELPVIRNKIVEIIRQHYDLSTEDIHKKLLEEGFQISYEDTRKLCEELAGEGRIERRYRYWSYPYRARIIDVLKENRGRLLTIDELMKSSRIDVEERGVVENILREKVMEILNSRRNLEWTLNELSREVGLVCEDLVHIIPEEFLDGIVEVSIITPEYTEMVLLRGLRESLQALFERHASEISLRYPSCVSEIVRQYIEDVEGIANYISEHRRIGEGLEEATLKLSDYLLEFIEPACSRKPCRNMGEVEDVVERLIIEGYKEIIVEFIQIGRHYTDNIQRLVEIFSRRGFREYKRDTNPEEQSDNLRIRITFHRVE